MSLLNIDEVSTRNLYKPGTLSIGTSALICPAETDNSGKATVFVPLIKSTRVVPNCCGSAPDPAAKDDCARFCPVIEMMLPGAGDMYGLKVTPSTTELDNNDGEFTAFNVKVTDSAPADATTC